MTLPLSRATSVLALLLAAWAPDAAAQLDSALLSKLRFNLTNPGGKSLAMGGAFSAIADDATAALANPAGLGLISSVEIAVSGKRVDETLSLATARSVATGSLVTPYPPVTTSSVGLDTSTTGVEFAGVVVPISRRLVAALTYAENLRFEGDAGAGGYPYLELRDNRSPTGTTRLDYLYEFREYGSVKLSNRLLAGSLAYRVNESLRIGGGVTLNRATFDLEGDSGGPHRIVSTNYRSPTSQETLTTTLKIDGVSGTQVGFVVGVHADLVADGKLTFGADYRWTPASEGTLVLGGYVPPALAGQEARTFRFRVPSDASVGLAAHPLPGLTIAAEVQWVRYGEIFDRALPVVSYAGLAGPFPGVPVSGVLADLSPAPNVFVPRLGFEYIAGGKDARVAFRVGYHREPAHGVTASLAARDASGQPYPITDPPFSESVAAVFDGGKADDRFTGGLGLTVLRALSVDFGFDVGRDSRQFAVSLFYRF
jgi:long-subunit fatty acid transport protein